MPYPNWIGGRNRYWMRERVIEALASAAAEIKGNLPCLDRDYSRIKKGRLDWPPATRILEYFGAMSRGWLAAGADKKRVSLHNVKWTEDEIEYLFTWAGIHTLQSIAEHLRRTYNACRGQLRDKTASRHNQGYLSAAEIAKEYDCSYTRVRQLLTSGVLRGEYDSLRNRWDVAPEDITPEVLIRLTAPKRTHKSVPTDKGDYYCRHGLFRKLIDGKLVRVKQTTEVK